MHIAPARHDCEGQGGPARDGKQQLGSWPEAHDAVIALLITTLALLVRAWAATGTYLDPDEALHYTISNQSSLEHAYKASLNLVHPPLLILTLYYLRNLGTSELILRIPSVIAGTLFCWVAYRWMLGLAGRTAGWIGLILFSFLPPLIGLSAEVRQYADLLLFAACALYFLERALARNSVCMLLLSLISLYLAMLFHYSAILFAAAIGGYALVRMATQRVAQPVIVSWATGQLGGLGLSLIFYVTHISKLEKSGFREWMRNSYLPTFHFRPHQDNALLFLAIRTGTVFQYVFGQPVVGIVAVVLFVTGLVLLCRKDFGLSNVKIDGRLVALTLLLPFGINAGAALARAYPFGGTRQCLFLAIFAIVGVSIGLSKAVRQRIGYGVAAAVVIVLLCNLFGRPPQPYMRRASQRSKQMESVIEFVQQQIPPAEPIFVDYETGILLGHYLCHQKPVPRWSLGFGLEVLQCGNHRIISATVEVWMFNWETFLAKWGQLVNKYDLRLSDRVWVVEYKQNLDVQLRARFPGFRPVQTRSFGPNITFFELTFSQGAFSMRRLGGPGLRPT